MDIRETYGADERFTPEEAVEILKRAVALEKDQFSVEDLYTMGHEAGVSREAVQRAIESIARNSGNLRKNARDANNKSRRNACGANANGNCRRGKWFASACVSFKWLFWWSCFSGFLR